MMKAGNLKEIEKLVIDNLSKNQFLVKLYIKPTNNIKVLVDSDTGITIGECIDINKAIRSVLNQPDWYPEGDFSLEVGSPGANEPLLLKRQYQKHIGRVLKIKKHNDEKEIKGVLMNIMENTLYIEVKEGKGKKMKVETLEINFEEIEQATVEIMF